MWFLYFILMAIASFFLVGPAIKCFLASAYSDNDNNIKGYLILFGIIFSILYIVVWVIVFNVAALMEHIVAIVIAAVLGTISAITVCYKTMSETVNACQDYSYTMGKQRHNAPSEYLEKKHIKELLSYLSIESNGKIDNRYLNGLLYKLSVLKKNIPITITMQEIYLLTLLSLDYCYLKDLLKDNYDNFENMFIIAVLSDNPDNQVPRQYNQNSLDQIIGFIYDLKIKCFNSMYGYNLSMTDDGKIVNNPIETAVNNFNETNYDKYHEQYDKVSEGVVEEDVENEYEENEYEENEYEEDVDSKEDEVDNETTKMYNDIMKIINNKK